MGLLVGNTTVIEHAGVTIQHARTASVNYQSVNYGITFVCPKHIPVSDGYFLAEQIINVKFGAELKQSTYQKAAGLCQEVFGIPLFDFYTNPPKFGKKKDG